MSGKWGVRLFGGVTMTRLKCRACRKWSLKGKGEWRCDCGSVDSTQDSFEAIKRVGLCYVNRTSFIPPKAERERILADQQNRCAYCDREFGSFRIKVGCRTAFQLKICWDHVVPWEYARTHKGDFVASCQTCNSIKSSKMFSSMDQARAHIALVRERRHVDLHSLDVPVVQDRPQSAPTARKSKRLAPRPRDRATPRAVALNPTRFLPAPVVAVPGEKRTRPILLALLPSAPAAGGVASVAVAKPKPVQPAVETGVIVSECCPICMSLGMKGRSRVTKRGGILFGRAFHKFRCERGHAWRKLW